MTAERQGHPRPRPRPGLYELADVVVTPQLRALVATRMLWWGVGALLITALPVYLGVLQGSAGVRTALQGAAAAACVAGAGYLLLGWSEARRILRQLDGGGPVRLGGAGATTFILMIGWAVLTLGRVVMLAVDDGGWEDWSLVVIGGALVGMTVAQWQLTRVAYPREGARPRSVAR